MATIPSPLHAGDGVALLSPAGWPDDGWMGEAVAIIESWGLRAVSGQHVQSRHGYMAGRDDERLADLNDAIRDPTIRAIIALRAGMGSLRLLCDVDREALRRDPKPLVGFSDITALHRAWHLTGVPSLHGA